MGKYIQNLQSGPWVQKESPPALVPAQVEEILMPAGQHKRGPFGSPVMGGEGSAATVVSAGTMYNLYISKTQQQQHSRYIELCTNMYRSWTECPPALYLVVQHFFSSIF